MKNLPAHLGALLVVTIWGTTFVSSKILLNSGLFAADIFLYRFMMAYVCMCILSHKRMWADCWLDELALLGMGIMGGSLYFLTENVALMFSTSANVSILVSTSPLLTAAVLAMFYKSERLNRRQVLGSIIAFVGVVLVVLNGQLYLHLNPIGDALALSAALTWAFYSLLMRRIMGKYSTDFITRKVFAYGLLTILPTFWLYRPLCHDMELLTQPIIICNLLFLGLIASTMCYLLWNWVMHNLGAVKSTNYIYVQSLFTMLAATLILGEQITWMACLGAFVLIFGMIIVLK